MKALARLFFAVMFCAIGLLALFCWPEKKPDCDR